MKDIAGLNPEENFSNSTVLLIYVYTNTHQYAYGNLKYFIETAVRERDGVDYIFILQQMDNKEINITNMPPLDVYKRQEYNKHSISVMEACLLC